MALIVTTADIDRPAGQVFAYATDPSRFSEWQQGLVDGHMNSPGPTARSAPAPPAVVQED